MLFGYANCKSTDLEHGFKSVVTAIFYYINKNARFPLCAFEKITGQF